MSTDSKRNKKVQLITLKDGSIKKVFHDKDKGGQQYADFRSWWKRQNEMPKPNSKRQRMLKKLSITV